LFPRASNSRFAIEKKLAKFSAPEIEFLFSEIVEALEVVKIGDGDSISLN